MEEIDKNTVIVGDPHSYQWKDCPEKRILELKHTLEQMDLSCINISFHAKAAEYMLLPNAHRTFSQIDDMTGH